MREGPAHLLYLVLGCKPIPQSHVSANWMGLNFREGPAHLLYLVLACEPIPECHVSANCTSRNLREGPAHLLYLVLRCKPIPECHVSKCRCKLLTPFWFQNNFVSRLRDSITLISKGHGVIEHFFLKGVSFKSSDVSTL
jgi:hypothetical protein